MADGFTIHGVERLSPEAQVAAIDGVRDAAISRARWSAITTSVFLICAASIVCTCMVVTCG